MISEPIAIFFILASLVTLAIWLEKRSKMLRKLGSAALVILLGMLLSNVGFIPGDSTVYDFLMGPGGQFGNSTHIIKCGYQVSS